MPEETDPGTQDVEWVSLTEAFNEIGRMKFGVDWDKNTISLSPGAFRLEARDEELPIRIDYSIEYNYPEEWKAYLDDLPHEHPIASKEVVAQYDETKELLLGAIWEGRINVEAIASDGEISEIPRKAWKDTTRAFEISFPDSEVNRLKPKDSVETWRVRVDLNDLQELLRTVDSERRDAVRKRAARKNPSKGGAPLKYDWPGIEQYIAEALRKSEADVSYAVIARLVEKRLTDDGIDPPVESALRERVKKVRETG